MDSHTLFRKKPVVFWTVIGIVCITLFTLHKFRVRITWYGRLSERHWLVPHQGRRDSDAVKSTKEIFENRIIPESNFFYLSPSTDGSWIYLKILELIQKSRIVDANPCDQLARSITNPYLCAKHRVPQFAPEQQHLNGFEQVKATQCFRRTAFLGPDRRRDT